MSRNSWLVLILWSWAAATACAADAPLAIAPQDGVVLLRNGQVLSGKVTQAGEEYYVALPGGEIRLRSTQIELVCRDLREGYERKQARLDPDKVADHLDLSLWCIRQRLFEEAAKEIADARALDARHPRIALVERQLKLAQVQPTRNDRREPGADAGPTTEDLDRLLRGMPQGTVETFAVTVQPLLLNTCGNAGCHGPQSDSKLRLLKTQLGKSASRRFTQRNLYAVLEMIDRDDPPSSPLLTAPIAPHGNAKAAIFTNREVTQYRQLVQWVMKVSRSDATQMPASVETPEDHLSQRMPKPGQSASGVTPNPLFVGADQVAPSGTTVNAQPPLATKGGNKRGAAKPVTTEPAGDPFDPEIFNREYLPPK